MKENHDYLVASERSSFRLSADVMALMLKGAGYAAVFCLSVWVILTVIMWLGLALPEDSRDRPDPTPFSFIMTEPQATDLV